MPPQTSPTDETTKLLAQLWEKNLPVLRQRLDQLEAASTTVPLPAKARKEAAATAHKLAGSLGMFGYPKGTALARKMEVMLGANEPDPKSLARLVKELRAELRLG